MMQAELKRAAALAALDYIEMGAVIGVGTGSTVDFFIDALVRVKGKIEAAVSSSEASTQRLKALGIPVLPLTAVDCVSIYVDGADEIDAHGRMIKGAGGALTREKIVASSAATFVCIVDGSKQVSVLGKHPVAVEVFAEARSVVARALLVLGGNPEYRQGVVTDFGNRLLDVYGLPLENPLAMETAINLIPGVVDNGIFAHRRADIGLVATEAGVKTYHYQ